MDTREPKRWSADAADGGDAAELVAGVRAARAEGPSLEQLARMRAALALPPALPPAIPSSPAVGLAWPLKLIAFALVLTGASLGLWQGLRPAENPAPAPQSTAKQTPRSAPGMEPPVLDRDAAPEPRAAPQAPHQSQPALPKPKRVPTPRTAADSATNSPQLAKPAPVEVQAELAILRPARAHVRSAPARALQLVAEHARRYPHGALIEEREVIAIEALLASGRLDQAAARARSFFDDYPRSAHARRVRSLLEEAGTDVSAHE